MDGYNPHSNRGRKKTTNEAPSKKAALNREAQRNLRQRKQNYINDLESKVAELTAALMQSQQSVGTPKEPQIGIEVAAAATLEIERLRRRNLELEVECQMLKSISVSRIPSTACISCFAERAKTAICMDQICALEAVVNGLKLQLNSLNLAGSGQNATPNPNLSESSLNFLSESGYWEDVKTSEQLYGAIEVDSFKITLKSLPSLKNRANLVDAYYDLLVEETKVTKPQAARKLLVKLLQAGRELTNACSILDRVKCLETMSVYHERNANHEIHFSKLCDSCTRIKLKFATRPLLALPPQVQTFRDTLRQIPSFQGSLNMIDELCSYGCYGCEESEDFFHYSLLLYQLESISCNIEDRTKFWMAFDIMSQSINGAIDGLLSQVSNLTM